MFLEVFKVRVQAPFLTTFLSLAPILILTWTQIYGHNLQLAFRIPILRTSMYTYLWFGIQPELPESDPSPVAGFVSDPCCYPLIGGGTLGPHHSFALDSY